MTTLHKYILTWTRTWIFEYNLPITSGAVPSRPHFTWLRIATLKFSLKIYSPRTLIDISDSYGQYVPKAFFTIDGNGNPSPVQSINAVSQNVMVIFITLTILDFRTLWIVLVVKFSLSPIQALDSSPCPSQRFPFLRQDKVRERSFPRRNLWTAASVQKSHKLADNRPLFILTTKETITKRTPTFAPMEPSIQTSTVVTKNCI